MLAAVFVAVAGVGITWMAWTRVLSLLILPAQAVYLLRQKQLEDARTEFLAKNQSARRVKIKVKTASGKVQKLIAKLADKVRGNNNSGGDDKLVEVGSLDGVEFLSSGSNRWYLHLNANGVCYEEKLQTTVLLQEALNKRGWKCNVLLVNYRGVGHSTGQILCGADLVADAHAAIEYLVKIKGAQPRDILVHGHSIGGGAAVLALGSMLKQSTSVRSASASDEDGSSTSVFLDSAGDAPFLLADRTFANLSDVVADKLGVAVDMGPIGALMLSNVAALYFSFLRFGLGITLENSAVVSLISLILVPIGATRISENFTGESWPVAGIIKEQATRNPSLKPIFAAFVRVAKCAAFASATNLAVRMAGPSMAFGSLLALVGYFLGQSSYLDIVALKVVSIVGWDMNVAPAWALLDKTTRTLVTLHEGDEMIPVSVSISELCADKNKCVHLTGNFGSPHMYELFMQPGERMRIFDRLSTFFNT